MISGIMLIDDMLRVVMLRVIMLRVDMLNTMVLIADTGNTKGGCITIPLTSCLTGLESAV
jgi:hypothetical protein